jgi:hypothetical protein
MTDTPFHGGNSTSGWGALALVLAALAMVGAVASGYFFASTGWPTALLQLGLIAAAVGLRAGKPVRWAFLVGAVAAGAAIAGLVLALQTYGLLRGYGLERMSLVVALPALLETGAPLAAALGVFAWSRALVTRRAGPLVTWLAPLCLLPVAALTGAGSVLGIGALLGVPWPADMPASPSGMMTYLGTGLLLSAVCGVIVAVHAWMVRNQDSDFGLSVAFAFIVAAVVVVPTKLEDRDPVSPIELTGPDDPVSG